MPLTGGTYLVGATIEASGGTSKTLDSDYQQVPNGVHLVDNSQTDFRIRPNVTFRIKPPVLQSDGTWSKMKHSFTYVEPSVNANGKVTFNLVRVEREVDPSLLAEQQANMLSSGAQFMTKAPFSTFWSSNVL